MDFYFWPLYAFVCRHVLFIERDSIWFNKTISCTNLWSLHLRERKLISCIVSLRCVFHVWVFFVESIDYSELVDCARHPNWNTKWKSNSFLLQLFFFFFIDTRFNWFLVAIYMCVFTNPSIATKRERKTKMHERVRCYRDAPPFLSFEKFNDRKWSEVIKSAHLTCEHTCTGRQQIKRGKVFQMACMLTSRQRRRRRRRRLRPRWRWFTVRYGYIYNRCGCGIMLTFHFHRTSASMVFHISFLLLTFLFVAYIYLALANRLSPSVSKYRSLDRAPPPCSLRHRCSPRWHVDVWQI